MLFQPSATAAATRYFAHHCSITLPAADDRRSLVNVTCSSSRHERRANQEGMRSRPLARHHTAHCPPVLHHVRLFHPHALRHATIFHCRRRPLPALARHAAAVPPQAPARRRCPSAYVIFRCRLLRHAIIIIDSAMSYLLPMLMLRCLSLVR